MMERMECLQLQIKKRDYEEMHKQECDTGLKGIVGQAVLPFLNTPGTEVQIIMTMHVGDSCLQV